VTLSVTPSDAMMKENSPICDRPMPTRSDVRVSLPPTNARTNRSTPSRNHRQRDDQNGLPVVISIPGLISNPMATKKWR